jgi:hypothetical protein
MSIASPLADGAASAKADARRHAPTARCPIASPLADGAASAKADARRHAPTARCPIASPLADGAASAKVDARRNVPKPRCQSPALQRHAPTARCQSPVPQRTGMRPRRRTPGGTPARRDFNRQPRSGQGSVHEGGRPAERPHGAISNRQPLPRRNARTARFPIASPSPGGTPARRDFQSPAPQRTGQRPRRWTPGGTPARRDVNRQPLPRRNARTARCPIASPSAARPRGAMSIASPSPGGTPARRDFQSPAPLPAERPHGAMSIASPAADGAASTKVDARRNARAARFPIASPSPLTPANHRSPQRTEQRRLTEPHD